ncbi:MAG: hypothetical protein BYD32DRAFT_435260 [Podila humilis]|nr:MAG: hypothetical protein BYD32DRAFT_435260 [Podila humilis]
MNPCGNSVCTCGAGCGCGTGCQCGKTAAAPTTTAACNCKGGDKCTCAGSCGCAAKTSCGCASGHNPISNPRKELVDRRIKRNTAKDPEGEGNGRKFDPSGTKQNKLIGRKDLSK